MLTGSACAGERSGRGSQARPHPGESIISGEGGYITYLDAPIYIWGVQVHYIAVLYLWQALAHGWSGLVEPHAIAGPDGKHTGGRVEGAAGAAAAGGWATPCLHRCRTTCIAVLSVHPSTCALRKMRKDMCWKIVPRKQCQFS